MEKFSFLQNKNFYQHFLKKSSSSAHVKCSEAHSVGYILSGNSSLLLQDSIKFTDIRLSSLKQRLCLMLFLNVNWRIGNNQLFRWHNVSCSQRTYTPMVICKRFRPETSSQHLIYQFKILTFNLLQLPHNVLDASCQGNQRTYINMDKYWSNIRKSDTNLTTISLINKLLNIKNPLQKFKKYPCSESVIMSKNNERTSALEVSKYSDGHRIILNNITCPVGTISVQNTCYSIKFSLESSSVNKQNKQMRTELESLLETYGVCLINYRYKGTMVKLTHGWCVDNFVANVESVDQLEQHYNSHSCPSPTINISEHCITLWSLGESNTGIKKTVQADSPLINLKHVLTEMFKCRDGSLLPWYKLCDGRKDCIFKGDEDICKKELIFPDPCINFDKFPCSFETVSYNMHKNGGHGMYNNMMSAFSDEYTKWVCGNERSLPCGDTKKSCFNLTHLCHYDTDYQGNLRFCENAAHLHGCKALQCVAKFKCPLSYCLGTVRICDGVNDCLDGEDEENCAHDNLDCPGFLRCQSGTCVHQMNICDGTPDCPSYADDEIFCDIAPCPASENNDTSCDCLWRGMLCLNLRIMIIDAQGFKYLSFHGDTTEIPKFQNGGLVVIANLSQTQLFKVRRDAFEGLANVAVIDLSYSTITFLQTYSFRNLGNLRILDTHHNIFEYIIDRDTYLSIDWAEY